MNQQLIFDTSIWVDFLHNKNTKEVNLLSNYIESNYPVILTPTIIQEVLQGIRDDTQFQQLKHIFGYNSQKWLVKSVVTLSSKGFAQS